MSTSVLAIFLILYIFATIIIGIIFGNKKLANTEGYTILGIYFIWFVIKQAIVSFILFAITILIIELVTKQEIWGYLALIVLGIGNYLYAHNKVLEEFKIMFKPGEGILTPEGRAKLEKYTKENK